MSSCYQHNKLYLFAQLLKSNTMSHTNKYKYEIVFVNLISLTSDVSKVLSKYHESRLREDLDVINTIYSIYSIY